MTRKISDIATLEPVACSDEGLKEANRLDAVLKTWALQAAEVMNKIILADISDSQKVFAHAMALSHAAPITQGFESWGINGLHGERSKK